MDVQAGQLVQGGETGRFGRLVTGERLVRRGNTVATPRSAEEAREQLARTASRTRAATSPATARPASTPQQWTAKVKIGKAFNANDISRDDFKKVLDTMPDGTIYSSREHFRTYSKENGEWIVTVGPETSVGKVASKEQMADVRNSRWGVTFNIPDANKAAEWRKKYKR